LVFFISFFCLHSKRSFGFRRIWSIIPLRETTLQRSFTQLLSSLDFSFIYHNTIWLDPGRVFGCIYNWQGPDTGGLFHFGLFPSVIFGSQEKDVHAAMHDARLSPRQKLLYGIFADILGTFFFPSSFHMFGLERLLGRYPPTRTTPEFNNSNRDILLLLSLAFPDSRRFYFNDDLFYDSMTNDDYFSDMMRLTNRITNTRLDVEHDFFSKAYRALSFTLHSARRLAQQMVTGPAPGC
jgi:hypothetical protein